jgi:hypothetical protein
MGIGQVVFRVLTTNLGPLYGMVASLAVVAAVTLSISLLVEIAAQRGASQAP